jgi:uncharacterized protein YdcH (DUF465 family)
MAEPENHPLRLLREFREEFSEFRTKTDRSFAEIEERSNRLHQALHRALGRYAATREHHRALVIQWREWPDGKPFNLPNSR